MHARKFLVRPDGFGGKEPFSVVVVVAVNFGETSWQSLILQCCGGTVRGDVWAGGDLLRDEVQPSLHIFSDYSASGLCAVTC